MVILLEQYIYIYMMSCISGWTGFWVLIVLVFLERQPAWAMDHSPLLKPEIINHLMVTKLIILDSGGSADKLVWFGDQLTVALAGQEQGSWNW